MDFRAVTLFRPDAKRAAERPHPFRHAGQAETFPIAIGRGGSKPMPVVMHAEPNALIRTQQANQNI